MATIKHLGEGAGRGGGWKRSHVLVTRVNEFFMIKFYTKTIELERLMNEEALRFFSFFYTDISIVDII